MKLRKLIRDKAGYAALIGGVVAVLVTIIVGVLIYYQIATNMHSWTPTSAAGLAAANLNTTANTIFQLSPIIGIVMIAGVILAIVTRFGEGGI